ncbi:YicC family protein [soil metagenome]
MLLSMTGYGEARYQSDKLNLSIELRSLNNRHLKLTVRAPEPYNLLEPEFEKIVRGVIRRGTVQLHLHCKRAHSIQDFQLNVVAIESYVTQLKELSVRMQAPALYSEAVLAQTLNLPGVAAEPGVAAFVLDDDWPILEKVLADALAKLQTMRLEEGKAMGLEFLGYRQHISEALDRIRLKAPLVVESYRQRLQERVSGMLSELDLKIDRTDLIKEVAIFAERSDVAEEITRRSSHLDQFLEIMKEPESPGRKLEFLTQEMFRETNTIGSKANDVEISRQVVEIKGTLEKIRELVQNIE